MDTDPINRLCQFSQNSWDRSKPLHDLRRVDLPDSEVLYLPTKAIFPFRSNKDAVPEIRHGIKHDCKDVFEIDINTAEKLNWECVYPIIKSRHISKLNGWTGDFDLVLIPNKSLSISAFEDFPSSFPLTYHYLLQHKERLLSRKSRWFKSGPFYSIFGIGPYSFSSHKIAWVRLGWKPRFSIIHPVTLPNGETKPVILSDHFLFIPSISESYASNVTDLLNSKIYQDALSILSSKKKSSLPKKLISRLKIPVEQIT